MAEPLDQKCSTYEPEPLQHLNQNRLTSKPELLNTWARTTLHLSQNCSTPEKEPLKTLRKTAYNHNFSTLKPEPLNTWTRTIQHLSQNRSTSEQLFSSSAVLAQVLSGSDLSHGPEPINTWTRIV